MIIVALALAGCGAAPEAAPREDTMTAAASPSAPKRIMFVGTSLTAGYGLDPEVAYPALIGLWLDSLGINYEVINAGVSGETSAGTLRRIGWVLSEPVEILVIETGANDGLRGLNVDTLRANLLAILDSVAVRQPAADVFVVGMEAPPNLGGRYTDPFRGVFAEVAAERGVRYIPFLLDGVAGVDSLNLPDGIHPNEAGARIVAANVWRELEPVVVERR